MENQIQQPSTAREGEAGIEKLLLTPVLAGDGSSAGSRQDETIPAGYTGSTHWSAILDDINDLKIVLGDSQIPQYDEDPLNLEVPNVGVELIYGTANAYRFEDTIERYLPSRIEIDWLLAIYFQGETYIVPSIHTYQSQRQYREFWEEPGQANPLWSVYLIPFDTTWVVLRA